MRLIGRRGCSGIYEASFVREPEVADTEFELQDCRQQERTYSASKSVKRHCGKHAFASLSKKRSVTNIFVVFIRYTYFDYSQRQFNLISTQARQTEDDMPRDVNVSELTRRLPTNDEIASAAEVSRALAHARSESGRLVLSGENGDCFQLAPAIADLIVALPGHVASGNMITLVPTGAMLTTQQAADILNVSRPFSSKLLK